MPMTMEAKVFPKRRYNIPTPGGDILEDVVDEQSVIYWLKIKNEIIM
jgi:hypothetical protein